MVYVIKSHRDEWTFEETMEQMGCRVYSLLPTISTSGISLTDPMVSAGRNKSGDRIHFDWLPDGESVGRKVEQCENGTVIDYMMIRMDSGENEWRILADLMAFSQLDRIKHLSMGVNLCPDRSSFTESNFHYVLDIDRQLTDQCDMKLFNVANDRATFVYNPVVKEKTYCASQFAWINQRFHLIDESRQQFHASSIDSSYRDDTRPTESSNVSLTFQ